MREWQIDNLLGQTPCICGSVQGWHGRCYADKTQPQVDAAYKRVYAKLRVKLAKKRKAALKDALSVNREST